MGWTRIMAVDTPKMSASESADISSISLFSTDPTVFAETLTGRSQNTTRSLTLSATLWAISRVARGVTRFSSGSKTSVPNFQAQIQEASLAPAFLLSHTRCDFILRFVFTKFSSDFDVIIFLFDFK